MSKGYETVDWSQLEKDLDLDCSKAELARRADVDVRTAVKMIRREPMQRAILRKALKRLGVSDPLLYIHDADKSPREAAKEKRVGEWDISSTPLASLRARGIPYKLYRATHRLDGRIARLKCFDLEAFADDQVEELEEAVSRHAKVCSQLEGHPNLPRHYDSRFEGRLNYWSADKWEAGKTLEDLVRERRLPADQIPRVAREVGEALYALHEAGVVLRCLTPESVLIRESDGGAMLLDLELAKVTEASYSREIEWKRSPYFADEVDSSDVDYRADLYSWGQCVAFCLTGKKPPSPANPVRLSDWELPEDVLSALQRCLQSSRSMRTFSPPPAGFDKVLEKLKGWG